MQIRPATEADIEQILKLVASTCAWHEAQAPLKYAFLPEPAQRYRHWLTRMIPGQGGVLLVAEVDGRIVGFTVATIDDEIPIYRVKRYGFVHDLWVEPDCRRHGVARALVEHLVQAFRERGLEQVRLDVLVTNEPARRLFAACGFVESTVEMILPLSPVVKKESE